MDFVLEFLFAFYSTDCLQTGFHCVVPKDTSGVLNCQQPPGCTMHSTATKSARAEQVILPPLCPFTKQELAMKTDESLIMYTVINIDAH